jgi:hypothetical protein
MMENKERLSIVLKLIDEVQDTLRDILKVQKGMGNEEFVRVNMDIQRLHSVKELIQKKD